MSTLEKLDAINNHLREALELAERLERENLESVEWLQECTRKLSTRIGQGIVWVNALIKQVEHGSL